MNQPGTLYIVATPIGNLEDITLRAIRILGEVETVAAEDTRLTARLLSHHGIRARLVSCHEHNEAIRAGNLIERLLTGASVALVTDAGTPAVSDPGFRLVRAAIEAGVTVTPIPGPSAALAALSASGLPSDAFLFAGFPPKKAGARREWLTGLRRQPASLIFYESPRRITGLLDEIREIMGDRACVLAREVTKLHEEFLRGPLSEVAETLAGRETVRGECTLVVSGWDGESGTDPTPGVNDTREYTGGVEDALREALASNMSPAAAAKRLSAALGLSRRELYAKAVTLQKEKNHE